MKIFKQGDLIKLKPLEEVLGARDISRESSYIDDVFFNYIIRMIELGKISDNTPFEIIEVDSNDMTAHIKPVEANISLDSVWVKIDIVEHISNGHIFKRVKNDNLFVSLIDNII